MLFKSNYERLVKKYSAIDKKEEKIYATFQAIEESSLLQIGLLISIVINIISGDILSLFLSVLLFLAAYTVSVRETIATITDKRVISLKKNKYSLLTKIAGIFMLFFSIFEGLTKTFRQSIIININNRIYIASIAGFLKIPPVILTRYLSFVIANIGVLLVFKSVIGFSNMFWFSMYVLRKRPEVRFFYNDKINEILIERKKRSRRIIKIIGFFMIVFGIITIAMVIGLFFILFGIFLIKFFKPKYYADMTIYGKEGTEVFKAQDVEKKYFNALAQLFGHTFLFSPPKKIEPEKFPEKVFPPSIGTEFKTAPKKAFWKSANLGNLAALTVVFTVFLLWSKFINNKKTISIGVLLILIIIILYYLYFWIKSISFHKETLIIADTYLMRTKQQQAWIIKTGALSGVEIKRGITIQPYKYAVHGRNKIEALIKAYKGWISTLLTLFVILFIWIITSISANPPFLSQIIIGTYLSIAAQIGPQDTHSILVLMGIYLLVAALINQFIHSSTGFLSLKLKNALTIPIYLEDEEDMIKAATKIADSIKLTSRPKRRPIASPPK